MSIYVKFEDIDGSVTTKSFKGWSEVKSFEFNGINRAMANTVGTNKDRITSRPSIGEVLLVKP